MDGDEIPIEKCDVLPVVRVKIDGTEMRFLLDTGATTVLNLGSFSTGRSKDVEVTSWSGTAAQLLATTDDKSAVKKISGDLRAPDE